jgi:hypothetical protein
MPRYTFDSFVVRDASREAFDAALAVAHNPPAANNPLVFFGPTRSGKTHLLHHVPPDRFPVLTRWVEQRRGRLINVARVL